MVRSQQCEKEGTLSQSQMHVVHLSLRALRAQVPLPFFAHCSPVKSEAACYLLHVWTDGRTGESYGNDKGAACVVAAVSLGLVPVSSHA